MLNGPLADIAALFELKQYGHIYSHDAQGWGAALRRLSRRGVVEIDKQYTQRDLYGTRWRLTSYGKQWLKHFANRALDTQWWNLVGVDRGYVCPPR